MVKRVSPKDIIEGQKGPTKEHVYIKYPGRDMEEVTGKSNEGSAEINEEKLLKILKENEHKTEIGLTDFKRYTQVHNHPVNDKEIHDEAMPSGADIGYFLNDRYSKTMVIAQQDSETKEVQGYVILRKKGALNRGSVDITRGNLRGYGQNKSLETLKKLAKEYDLQCRWIPREGYELKEQRDEKTGRRFTKRSNLEKQIAGILSLFTLAASPFFLHPTLTGNVVGNIAKTNWIGAILLITGSLTAYWYFKK